MKNYPHIGLFAKRLKKEMDNPRENAFADAWADEAKRNLAYLIGDKYTIRDAEVAATVIQWLGSNVGMSFLERVINKESKIKEYLQNQIK